MDEDNQHKREQSSLQASHDVRIIVVACDEVNATFTHKHVHDRSESRAHGFTASADFSNPVSFPSDCQVKVKDCGVLALSACHWLAGPLETRQDQQTMRMHTHLHPTSSVSRSCSPQNTTCCTPCVKGFRKLGDRRARDSRIHFQDSAALTYRGRHI